MADVDGGDQMPDVGRIERAPEYPDVLGLFGGRRHGRPVYGATCRSRLRRDRTCLDMFVTVETSVKPPIGAR